VIGCVDKTNLVAEWKEGNNCLGSINSFHASSPDLTVSSVLTAPGTYYTGDSFTANVTYNNIGTAAAPNFAVTAYLSSDGVAKSFPLGSVGSLSAAAGATGTATMNLTVAVDATSGSYFVLACADVAGVVGESNDSNNCSASTTTVTIKGATVILASSTGWYLSNDGGATAQHDAINNNFILGQAPDFGYANFRNFFVFDLSAVPPGSAIHSIKIMAQNNFGNLGTNNLPWTGRLYSSDATAITQLEGTYDPASATGGAIYRAMIRAPQIGTRVVTNINQAYLVMPMNSTGVDLISAAFGGQIAVATQYNEPSAAPGDNIIFNGSGGFAVKLLVTLQ
jgi:hypothetical protein